MTSITKELRKWGRSMLPPGMRKNGKPHLIDQLLAIANRIDAELAERYIELPLDVDRAPIHVGDMMVYAEIGLCPARVRAIVSSKIFLTDDGPRFANMCRHQPDTWESIIYDAMQAGRTEETIDVTPLIDRCKALVDIEVKALEDKIRELSFHEDMGR